MLTDNFVVRGDGLNEVDIGNIFMSPDGNDLTIPGTLNVSTDIEIGNGTVAAPSLNFASHTTTGLSASVLGLEFSVDGIEGLGIRPSTTPVNGLLIEMADSGGIVNIVPVGPDGAIGLEVRAKGGDPLSLQSIAGDVVMCPGGILTVSPSGVAVAVIGDVTATNFNGVPLTTAGASSNFLDETGNYSVPPDTGGQVNSVVGGTNITIDATDPINPIANLDSAITSTSVNGVTLSNGGAATSFLDETGSYSVPISGGIGNVTTSATLTDNFVIVGNGTEDIDITTASFNGDDLTLVGTIFVETGLIASPAVSFSSHTGHGLSAGATDLFLSVNGVLGLAVKASATPVNGLFIEMSDTGNDVNIVPEGTDGSIGLHIRAKGGDVRINQIAGDTFIGLDDQINVQNNGFTGIGKGVGTPTHVLELATDGAGDTIPIARISSTGTDSAGYRIFAGNRDGNTHITGFPGDVHHINAGALSGINISLAATSSTEWHSVSLNPPTIVEINNTAQFENLVSAGTFTVAEDTLLIVNVPVSTTSDISINTGVILASISRYKGGAGLTHTGTGTFISGEGSFISAQRCNLIGSGTSQLFNMTGVDSLIDLREIKVDEWDDLGSVENVGLLIDTIEMDNITVGLDMKNLREVSVKNVFQDGVAMAGALFTFDTFVTNQLYTFKDIRGNLTSTGSIFDFNPNIPSTTQIAVSECLVNDGNIFKKSQTSSEPFTLVSDSAVFSQAITGVQDDGNGFAEFLTTPVVFDGEEITISGFTTNTAYNTTIKIFDVVVNTSFVTNIPFGSSETGVWASNRILLFSAGNSFSNGDTAEVLNSQFYNGFYRVLDALTNEVEINHSFEGTDTGDMLKTVGLDERDPRIKAFSNFSDNANSAAVLFAERNGNTVETPVVSNASTYSTTQVNVINSQNTQRFRMISSQIGSFIYTGIETITLPVVATFTVSKGGGNGDYRAAVTVNDVDPTTENDGYVPMVIGVNKTNWTYEANITLETGDEVVSKIVGDGTSVAPTITDFRMIVG